VILLEDGETVHNAFFDRKFKEEERMKQNKFPPGWDEKRVRRVLANYEHQTEEEAVAEDESAYEQEGQSMVEIPYELVPRVRKLVAQYHLQKVD